MQEIKKLNAEFKPEAEQLDKVRRAIGETIVGQDELVKGLLLAILCNGHALIEGIPGLAKTLCVTTLAQTLQVDFKRIQFTPDLLPGDLIGTQIFNPESHSFLPHKGPLFSNIILADEINRSPAKVQSALLEAMQEKMITIGDQTFSLDEPFLVLATQNPLEQEGTYILPEAQVDRFMFKLKVTYPNRDEERLILQRMASVAPPKSAKRVLSGKDVLRMRSKVDRVHMDEKIEDYILDIVEATRDPARFELPFEGMLRYGASPRASLFLTIASRGNALMAGRGYVLPQDVKSIAADVLRHRVVVSYEAEAANLNSEKVVERILDTVEVP